MHPIRERCKRQHFNTITDLHEIIPWAWARYGDKYGRNIKDQIMWETVAKLYFVPELTIVISNAFNTGSADSARETLLQLKMYEHGPERVINALRRLSEYIDYPNAYIPASIDFNGRTYHILQREN